MTMSLKAQSKDSISWQAKSVTNGVTKKPVLFGMSSPELMLQSVSTVSGDQLLHRPAFQMENFFYGTLPGLKVSLENGLPSSQASIYLRGSSPLIVVDGIPRSDANIPVSQIESVSVIKDGLGLSMLGMASGNGVLYIKTKRGMISKLQVGFTAQMATSKEIFRPKHLDAFSYATLLNEARVNDGLSPLYSQTALDLYQSGTKPYTFPNVDWMKQILKDYAPIQQYNVTFRGGSNAARYFIDLNYYNQAGFIKEDKSINTYSTSNNYKKFSLRANLDVDLSPTTLLEANVFGQMFREIATGSSVTAIYSSLNETPRNAYPVLNPDGSLGASLQYSNNIYGKTIYSGYTLYPKTDLNIDMALTQKFKGVFDGVYLKGAFSYNSSYREALNRTKSIGVSYFWQDPNDNSDPTSANYTVLSTAGTQANSSSYNRQNRLLSGNITLGYDFNLNKHAFQTKVVGNYTNYLLQGTNLPFINSGLTFNAEYNYDKRYLAEIALNTMQSSQYKPGKRRGYFPAAGIGWVISQEDWFQKNLSTINFLKLRTTYGVNGDNGSAAYYRAGTGNVSDYYNYMKYYNSTGSVYTGGSTIISSSYLYEATLPYTSTWDHINRFTAGFDLKAFSNTLTATVEFFNNEYSKIPQNRITNNSYIYGVGLPSENTLKYRNSGIEVDLAYNRTFNQVNVYGNVNATFYKTKLKYNGEPTYPESYMQRVGQPYGIIFGYVADGLFKDQTEVDNYLSSYATVSDYNPQPGDIKYLDLNGDHFIDGKDIKSIGTHKALIEYGFMVGATWKRFDLSTQWAGIANNDAIIQDMPFGVNTSNNSYGHALEKHLNRWTATNNNPNADYPRLSATGNGYNTRTSTFWLKDVGYLRLKNIELSYTLPDKWTHKIKLSSARLFTNACNILTICPLKGTDPELLTNSGSVLPNIKSYNAGISIQF
ncbi:SusC/RagA family TonB-linked outer membrane protein [Bacteroides sedimenti]|uniref:SusC/RagA family TonB-linked outer membrane protein n=2 Tax=Bacteroides sedimenti TaxID=2136147 RepID=A0ABN6Z6T6_9BACE